MKGEKPITCTVITPERQVLEAHTDSVVIPAHDGELGVLRGRAPLMCELGIGTLHYRDGERQRRCFIDGGFAQVHDDTVTVLTDRAYRDEEITDAVIAEFENNGESADECRLAHDRLAALRRARSS